MVFVGVCLDEAARWTWVFHQKHLKRWIAQQLHCTCKITMQVTRKLARIASYIALSYAVGGEQLASRARHLFINTLKAPNETADVVVAVAISPDIVNHLCDG